MSKKSRTPDYLLKYLNKKTEAKGKCGVAWNNPDGSISIVFDEFLRVEKIVESDVELRLFPNDRKVQ